MGTLAAAIAQLENTNPAYNNPGAITDSAPGQTGSYFGAGIPIFSSFQAGEDAFQTKIANIYNGSSKVYNPSMTLDQFGETYAPGQNYGTSLSSILGVSSSTQLSSIPSGVGNAGAANPTSTTSLSSSISSGVGNAIKNFLFPGTSGIGLEDIIVIVVGLLLIAAGIFSFKQTQTVIQNTTSRVRDGVRTAAALGA